MFGYDRCSTTEEKSWSQLPFLLLWMIKDRLDFIDNVQLASVCQNWHSASASYTKKSIQSASSLRLPWIMQELEVNSSSRDFICMSRRKTFTIDLPEFHGATTLFSKRGWLLLWRKNFSYSATAGSSTNRNGGISNNPLPYSMFLMNPFTRATVKLPDVEKDIIPPIAGSFSTTIEGYPHCVVLRGSHSRQGLGLILRIAYVGDDDQTGWSEISFAGESVKYFDLFNGLLVHGQHVYCFDLWGMTIIYDLETHEWKEIPAGPENAETGLCHMMEYEGEIIRVDRNRGPGFSLTMSKYNGFSSSWEKFKTNDDDVKLKDISFLFLQPYCYHCFCAKATKEDGPLKKKAYVLQPSSGTRDVPNRFNVFVQDLADGSNEILLPLRSYASAKWVDIG